MNIREKLSVIQTQIKAPKNLRNTFGNYNYRNAEGICEAVKPYLEAQKCALTLADEIVEIGGRVYVKATALLMDNESSDESIVVTAYAREAESKKGMDDSQVTGATSSYARKYALNGLFLLDDTKDADTDEYHKTVNSARAKNNNSTDSNYDSSVSEFESKGTPKTETEAKELCSEKQVKFIESLIAKRKESSDMYLPKYNVKSFSEISKAQAKALIDYLSRE